MGISQEKNTCVFFIIKQNNTNNNKEIKKTHTLLANQRKKIHRNCV